MAEKFLESCRLRCCRQFAINERPRGSRDAKIINRGDYSAKLFTFALKGWSTSSVSRFDESRISRVTASSLFAFGFLGPARVLSALRPHTQSHHECFPSRFAVLFLLQEIFLLSVLFCLLAVRTNTKYFFDRENARISWSFGSESSGRRSEKLVPGVNFVK